MEVECEECVIISRRSLLKQGQKRHSESMEMSVDGTNQIMKMTIATR